MMPQSALRPDDRATVAGVAPGVSMSDLGRIALVAALMLGVGAGINRLPILFPDTIGYNRAGESIYAALGSAGHHKPAAAKNGGVARPAAEADDGVSTARSPYYGFALASTTRLGGVWCAAAVQVLVTAAALVLGARRLGVSRRLESAVIAIAATIGGLGFFAGVLMPDAFLGPVILALALLVARTPMRRGERVYWVAMLLAGLLFHRAFMAVALAVVVVAVPFWRARWFDRGGWRLAAAACLVAIAGHGVISPVTQRLLHKPMLTPPFVLARLAGGTVLPAYLDDACPTRHFLLCDFRGRMPLPPDRFLWFTDKDGGIYAGRSIADRHRLSDEAGTIVAGAVMARPVAAAAEAIRLSVDQLLMAGMNEFTERIQPSHKIDPALLPAMAAYPHSGIVAGDFPLATVSRITEATYLAALAVLVAALAVLAWPRWLGRQRIAPVDPRLIAAIAIVIAGLLANAAINATLSGVHDRYQGRIAWLATLAAAAALAAAATSTARVAISVPHPPRGPE